MGFKETYPSNSVFNKRRVCCSYKCCMSSCLNAKNVEIFVVEPTRIGHHILRQKFIHGISKNDMFHKKTKHIDTRFHFIRELVNNKEICLEFCKSKDQLADIFTKPLANDTFQYLTVVILE